jgi:hypothetical protein
MPEKLLLPPNQAGYSFEDFSTVLSARLDGGPSRTRADSIGGDPTVNVQWTLTRDNFQTLIDFYRTTTKFGSLSFFLDLYLDSAGLEEYECHFLPDSFRLQSQSAHKFVVEARLEVKPSDRDQVYELAIIMVFEEYGSIEEFDETIAELPPLFVTMQRGAFPYSTIDAENSALVLVEYGSLESASEAFQEFDVVFEAMESQPRTYDPEFSENLAIILSEYGSVDVTDETMQEFETLLGNMEDTYSQELDATVQPLADEYPCCSVETLDLTLQELETLIDNLSYSDIYDAEYQENSAIVVAEYGSAQIADDTLQYMEFVVNYQLPKDGKGRWPDYGAFNDYLYSLFDAYGSEHQLAVTIAEFEPLMIALRQSEPEFDQVYNDNLVIFTVEYGSAIILDETLEEFDILFDTMVQIEPSPDDVYVSQIIYSLILEYGSTLTLTNTFTELETLLANL